jgi:Type IV secretion-system coupling protein DNA-binding domain
LLRTLTDWLPFNDRPCTLRIPREEESESILLLGDPGTGKSQTIHQFMNQIAMRTRPEAGVCYDPACEFLEAHFDPETDIILNPLDARFLYWSPSREVVNEIDLQMVADSFFPCHDKVPEPTRFFIQAARDIFMLMLARKPTAPTLVEWLRDEKTIDEIVAGTESAHKINKKARPQRVAVLSTLSDAARLLKMLPAREDCQRDFSLTQWAKRRHGWIFITSTQDTRDALRPLQAAFLNILMKRLLSVDRSWCRDNPCWFVVDEVHALKYLPALPTFMVESRKYGIKSILGTQSKHQMKEHYGDNAATMLASAHLKLYMRCNESEAAQWVANNIGEEERERPRVGASEAVESAGRNSTNYSTFTEKRSVVSKEQIMALPNLHGYWKYADQVVPFRIAAHDWPRIAKGFVQRPKPTAISEAKPQAADVNASQVRQPLNSPQPSASAPAASPAAQTSTQVLDNDILDLNF